MILELDDWLFIAIAILLIIFSVLLIKVLKNKEKDMEAINKAKKDMIDLESITKNIERDYKPFNIELTSYEKAQEDSAIISYEELIKNKDNQQLKYDESYESSNDVQVRKLDFSKQAHGVEVETTKTNMNLMNYEKEEAFLAALKQLKIDLAR